MTTAQPEGSTLSSCAPGSLAEVQPRITSVILVPLLLLPAGRFLELLSERL